MARKRVNKKFAVILASVIGGVAVVGAGAYVFLRPKETPEKYELLTQQALDAKQFAEAYVSYQKSASLTVPPDASKYVKLAMYGRMAGVVSRDFMGTERQALERALEIDPTQPEALAKLMEFYWEFARAAQPAPENFKRVRDMAERLLVEKPEDKRAYALMRMATLLGWMKDVDTEASAVETAIKELSDATLTDPGDGEPLLMISNAYLKKAQIAARQGRTQDVEPQLRAISSYVDEVLARHDQSVPVLYRAITVYGQLRATDPTRRTQHESRYTDLLARAKGMVAADKPYYIEVMLLAAQDAAQQSLIERTRGNPTAAEEAGNVATEIYKRLVAQRPENLGLRLTYAEFLNRSAATRREAIDLLNRPFDRIAGMDTSSAIGGEMQRNLETRARIKLQEYRLDAIEPGLGGKPLVQDAKEVEAFKDAVRAEVSKLIQEFDSRPEPLILRGRLEFIEGRYVEAVRTFGQARLLMERNRDTSTEYYEMMMRLSDAFASSQQTGQAKETLRVVINGAPFYMKARYQYIQMLARERAPREQVTREYEDAKRNLRSEDAVGREILAQLERLLTIGEGTADAEKAYTSMPETNARQRTDKARLAMGLRNFDEAVRLLTDVYSENTGDPEVAAALVQALSASGRNDQAREIITKALADHPENATLKVLQLRLTGGSVADMRKAARDAASDDLTRFKLDYEWARQDGNLEAARAALSGAQGIAPTDKWVMDILFQTHLREGRFEDAERMLPELVAKNSDSAGGVLYRFKLQQARGRKADALATAQQLTRDMPEFAQAWLVLGQSQTALGDHAAALASYQQALTRQPDNIDALKAAIDAYYQIKQPADALRLLNDALSRFPNDAELRDFRINHELSFGKSDEAIKIREQVVDQAVKATEANPNDPRGRELLLRVNYDLANSYTRVAAARLSRGDVSGARTMWTKSARAFVKTLEFADRPEAMADIAANISFAGAQSDKPEEFEPVLRRISDTPSLSESTRAELALANFYVNTRRPAEAEKSLREAVRRGKGDAEPRSTAARLLVSLGKVDDALAMLDGITDAKDNRAIQVQRAEILLAAARFDQAEKVVRAMLASSPNDIELQNLLTIVFVNNGIQSLGVDAARAEDRFRDAMIQISEVLRADPKNNTAIYYRGVVNLKSPRGDVGSAVQDFQVVRDSGRMTPDMRMMLVEAYKRSSQDNAALREVREIIRQQPGALMPRLQLVDWLSGGSSPKLDEALAVIDEGLALPELANDPSLWLTRMKVLVVKKDFDNAIAAGQRGVAFSNGDARAIQAYLETLVAARRFTQVLTETDPIVQRDGPKPFWIHIARGISRKGLEDRDGAVNEFVAALASSEDDEATIRSATAMSDILGADSAIAAIEPKLDQAVRWRLMAALLHQNQKRSLKAVEVLEPVLARVDSLELREKVQLLRTAGMLLVSPGEQNNYNRAADIYRKLLALNPNDIPTLNNLAFILSDKVTKPNIEEALTYSSKAVEILRRSGSVDPLVFDTHGWILVLAGRVSEGINILNEAVSRRSFLEGHYHLGAAYLKANMPLPAIEQLRKAKELAASPYADPTYKAKIDTELQKAEEMQKATEGNR